LADLPTVDSDFIKEVPVIRPYQEDREHTITDILERPYHIADFDWQSSAPQDKVIQTIEPVYSLIRQNNFAKKLYNFKYYKFGIQLRFMTCFQRFQCGKLLISAVPFKQPGGVGDPAFTAQMSTAHHVELDAGSREEVVLNLPYLYDRPAWDTTAEDRQFCWSVTVIVLNPLTGTTNNEIVNVQVYATATDVELSLPVAQSNSEGIRKSKAGVISSTAGIVDTVATALTNVPFLSAIAGPVSWVARGVGGLASAFGFSKPMNVATSQRVINLPGYGFTNVDGEDHGVNLALTLGNEVEQLPEVDDMDINTLTKRQGWIGRGDWKASDPPGVNIFSVSVGPYHGVNTVYQSQMKVVEVGPPVTFVARMFQYWRGSMTFRISFAKNQFYSGKLAVVFQPTQWEATLEQSDSLYRQVISVKDSNDFLFTIPYISNRDWLSVDESIGSLTFMVLNRLQAAETVADSIQFNIWCSSPDMQFAVPVLSCPQTFRRFEAGPTTQLYPSLPHAQTGIVPGVAETDVAPEVFMFRTKGPSVRPTTTIGEEITSLRPLIRRFTDHSSETTSTMVTNMPCPYAEGLISVTDPNALNKTHAFRYMAPAYLFFRGGVRWKALAPAASILAVEQGETPGILNNSGASNGLLHMVAPRVNPLLEFTLPFYCQTDRRYTGNHTTQGRNGSMKAMIVSYDDTMAVTNAVRNTFIAGSDDSTFSVFVYSPPIVHNM